MKFGSKWTTLVARVGVLAVFGRWLTYWPKFDRHKPFLPPKTPPVYFLKFRMSRDAENQVWRGSVLDPFWTQFAKYLKVNG